MTRFLARRLLNYMRAAGPGVVPDVPADVGVLQAAGQLEPAQPAATAGGHRRQGRRTRPGPAAPAAVGELGIGRRARRLRHDHHGPARVRRAVAPHRRQPAARGHRLRCWAPSIGVVVGAWGAIRQYRLSDRVITALSLLLLSTPTFVIANLLILGALTGEFGSRCAAVRVHRRDFAGCRRRRGGTNSSTGYSIWCCRRSRSR